MILRRLSTALRTQDWFTVAVELAIVIIGVFLGLQVNNWNEARADDAVAAGHLSEIAEDLQSHLDFHDQLYGSAVHRIAAVDAIYRRAFNRELPDTVTLSTLRWVSPPTPELPEETLSHVMGSVNLVRVSVGSRKGYESLISSGHLGLVRNRDLARAIQLYYGGYDDLLDTGEVFRAFRNIGATANHQFGVSVFDERPLEEIITITRENPAFAAYLRSTREWAIVHAGLLEELRVESENLLDEIRAELEHLR